MADGEKKSIFSQIMGEIAAAILFPLVAVIAVALMLTVPIVFFYCSFVEELWAPKKEGSRD